MKLRHDLHGAFSSELLLHPRFEQLHARLRAGIEDRLEANIRRLEVVVGPARVGLTELFNLLCEDYPSRREAGRLNAPVLRVSVSAGAAPSDFLCDIIAAMGLPTLRESSRLPTLMRVVAQRLEAAGVRVLLVDEAHRLIETASRNESREVCALLSTLHEECELSVFLSGNFAIRTLVSDSPTLCGRGRRPIPFLPYRWDVPDERRAFSACVSHFIEAFRSRGCPLDCQDSPDQFLRQTYALSGGNFGLLLAFFDELANHIISEAEVTAGVMAHAASRLNLPGSGEFEPFSGVELRDEYLVRVWAEELAKYDVFPEADTAQLDWANRSVQTVRMG